MRISQKGERSVGKGCGSLWSWAGKEPPWQGAGFPTLHANCMYIQKDPLLFQAAKSQHGDLGNALTEGLNNRGLRGKLNEEAFAIFLRSGLRAGDNNSW